MTDSLCLVCGSETAVDSMAYRCAYCGEPVCSEHRLPENHGCTGSQLPDEESAKGREAKPMRLSNDQTVGTTPTDTGQSGPDVALDGSVVGEEPEKAESGSPPWWKRLLPW